VNEVALVHWGGGGAVAPKTNCWERFKDYFILPAGTPEGRNVDVIFVTRVS